MPDADAKSLNPTDAELMRQAGAGDRAAFGEVVTRHQASVFRLAGILARDRASAEDLLQQTFLSAWQAAAQFRGDASVRTWLFAIARHAAFRHAERRAREPIADTPLDALDERAELLALGLSAGWGSASPEALVLAAEDRARVEAALGRLDADDREILTLRELEDLPGDETARLLGISVAAMKSRLHRARLRLAAALTTETPHATRS